MGIDSSKFFLLDTDWSGQTMFVSAELEVPFDIEFEVASGQRELEQPIVFRGTRGRRRRTDVLVPPIGYLKAVSARFVQILSEAGCTGWGILPAEVFDTHGELWPDYSALIISGSQVKPFALEDGSGMSGAIPKRGLSFNERDWDGSDFFWLRRHLCFTQKVHDLVRRNHVTNVPAIPLSEFDLPIDKG